MTYKEIIRKVAESLDLPIGLVDKTYKGYWKSVREHIEHLPLKENLTDEQFLVLQPNVNIPSIGKLYVTLDRYRRVKDYYNKVNNLNQDKDATH